MTVYKIRHRETGQFYSKKQPYTQPRKLTFGPVGRTWSRLGHAKLAMDMYAMLLAECEIVEFETTEVSTTIPVLGCIVQRKHGWVTRK